MKKIIDLRLKICNLGCILLKIFCITTLFSILYLVLGYMGKIGNIGNLKDDLTFWIINTIIIIVIENIFFWIGIILVYLTSKQLGIKIRILGVLFGMLPILNIIMLFIIIKTSSKEVKFENEKYYLNKKRKQDQICKTKYPILLVHGVFFRDFKYFNYWGRVPKELEKNGATIFYGAHNSAASVENSAIELENRIKQIIKETGCEKVNIIAHSKGGLDSRMAIARGNISKNVASLTTISTPHRGCEYADYLLNIIPKKQFEKVKNTYNRVAEKLGDIDPDFESAVKDLTTKNCKLNEEKMISVDGIYCQSVGSKLNNLISAQFPLNCTYNLVKYFDGPNDGLVGEKSFEFGEKYTFLTTEGKYGISHGDMIDLNRKNLDGFDVREFYVQLVADLKNRGL